LCMAASPSGPATDVRTWRRTVSIDVEGMRGGVLLPLSPKRSGGAYAV
jgi:hypothetical protein